MLYETLNHINLLYIFFVCGILAGIVFDCFNFIKFSAKNNKIAVILFDFFATNICLTMVFFVNLKYNYGLIRLFPYLCFMLSFCLERLIVGKYLAKKCLSCYNFFTKKIKVWRNKNAKTDKND